MLPIFPKARKAMQDTYSKELFRAMWDVSPLLKEIRTRPQSEGREASYERGDGKIVEIDYKLRGVQRTWQSKDAEGLTPEEFLESAADIGREMGEKMLADILSSVSEAAQEVGNVVNCEGKGMTFEKFLAMLANVHTEFDDLGNPDMKTFVGSPQACAEYTKNVTSVRL
jgi:predicted lipoprotein